MNWLIVIALVAAVVVAFRLMNVLTISQELSGRSAKDELHRDIKANAMGLMAFMVLGLVLFFYMIWKYMPFTLPESASEHGVRTDHLLKINFYIIIVVFIITQIALFWFVYKYRYRKGEKAYYWPHNNTLEVVWTIAPTIVLAGLVITGLNEWIKITSKEGKEDGMNIQVYAYQFGFISRYSGADNKLGESYFRNISSDNPLGLKMEDTRVNDDIISNTEMHFPVNTPIMLNINSRDILHSVYLPHFRTQMNAVPGMTTSFYFKPTITTAEMRNKTGNDKFDYILLCNKICGVSHYRMNMKVVVDSKEDFEKWLKTQKPAKPAPETTAASNSNATKSLSNL